MFKSGELIEKARTGIDWYSGGVYGICTQVFDALSNILKLLGVVTLILLHAPLLFIVTALLILVSAFVNRRQNGDLYLPPPFKL